MKPKESVECFIIAFIAAVMTSCASAPTVTKMTPSIDYSAFTPTDKTIRVHGVYGGESTDSMGTSKIESKGFQEALITTLRNSNIFKEVFVDRSGDYELKTQIVSQKMTSWLASTNVTLFVHYRFFDTKTNNELWSGSIVSKYDTDISNKDTTDQGVGENEGAVRDNLTQLLKKLADLVSNLR